MLLQRPPPTDRLCTRCAKVANASFCDSLSSLVSTAFLSSTVQMFCLLLYLARHTAAGSVRCRPAPSGCWDLNAGITPTSQPPIISQRSEISSAGKPSLRLNRTMFQAPSHDDAGEQSIGQHTSTHCIRGSACAKPAKASAGQHPAPVIRLPWVAIRSGSMPR